MAVGGLKKRVWTLREALAKLAVMTLTVVIGLSVGGADSYKGFYIAALVQSINNVYDAVPYLEGYSKFVTGFQILSFLGGVASFVISIIQFTDAGAWTNNDIIVGIVCGMLSIPIIHLGIEIIEIWNNKGK